MPFGSGSVVTSSGKGIAARRHIGATPSQAEPLYVGIGTGATGAGRTAAVGDTALSNQVESRVAGTSSTVATAVTDDTYQVVATVTAASPRAVDEAGTFDAATSGNMDFSTTFAVINLGIGDSLTLTFKKQFA